MEVVCLMLDCGAKDYDTGLRVACQMGHVDIVRLMLDCGASDYNTGLQRACMNGHRD